MKKLLVLFIAALLMLASCQKKEDKICPASPLPYGAADSTALDPSKQSEQSGQKKDFVEQLREALEAKKFTATRVSSNAVILSQGGKKVLLEGDADGNIYVSDPISSNARISKTPLKMAGAKNGGFYGITIFVTPSNQKEISNWFLGDDNNPFEILFGEETFNYFNGATPATNYVFAPKINVSKLPRGAFETMGTLSARKEGSLSGPKMGSKVSVSGEAPGMFSFYMDDKDYAQNGAYSMLITNQLSEKDYVTANGVTYYGSKDGKSTSFMFMLGLGKGANASQMSGIMIGLAAGKKANSAMVFIGVFGGLKVK